MTLIPMPLFFVVCEPFCPQVTQTTGQFISATGLKFKDLIMYIY